MDLRKKRCVPCEGRVKPLTGKKARELLRKLDAAWRIRKTRIERRFRFRDFWRAMSFANKVAVIAEKEGHHPDIHVEKWNNVRIVLYTHAIGGLHENDFIVAAKIDALV